MEMREYQERALTTVKYPDVGNNFVYPTLGLVGEAGEVADKIKKFMRDDGVMTPRELSEDQRQALAKEIGDVLWYVAQLSTECGLSLETIAEMNIAKLSSRRERGTLNGNGDDR